MARRATMLGDRVMFDRDFECVDYTPESEIRELAETEMVFDELGIEYVDVKLVTQVDLITGVDLTFHFINGAVRKIRKCTGHDLHINKLVFLNDFDIIEACNITTKDQARKVVKYLEDTVNAIWEDEYRNYCTMPIVDW